jgi:uncharacterized protein YkwD
VVRPRGDRYNFNPSWDSAERKNMRSPRRRRFLANTFGLVLILVIGLAAVLVLRLGDDGAGDGSVVVGPFIPGVGLTVRSQSLYPEDHPWKAYLAPDSACSGGDTLSTATRAQERTMVCLLNWARKQRGLPALREKPLLSQAARLKARDIAQCQDFAHEACGKASNAVVVEAGYVSRSWGENLYAGSKDFGRPRVAVSGWLNSAGHRENLFRGEWTEQGVSVLRVERFDGQPDVSIWVSHFGES